MINFRYHLVSILAIFLAIAIGTVMGASFVGRGVIDQLQNRIDTIQKRTAVVNKQNGRLSGENDKLVEYANETAALTVGQSLTGASVNLVVARGIDPGVVDAQAALVRQAGGVVPGVLWLEDRWKLASAEDAAALQAATGLTDRMPATLRVGAARLLGRRLAAVSSSTTSDLLTTLADAKFVTLSGVAGTTTPRAGDFGVASSRVLELGGPGHAVPDDVAPAVAEGVLEGSAKIVVGEVFVASNATADRRTWIDPVANLATLKARISTVDDLDRVEGRVGAVLALAELGQGRVGNYGLGRDRAVPDKLPTFPGAR